MEASTISPVTSVPTARRLRFVVVIVGVSGLERYLDRASEVSERRMAQRFRTEKGARTAAQSWIGQYALCIQRQMRFRVESA